MKTLSVSEVQRDLGHLKDFDILEIVDKKKGQVKGYFLESKYKYLIDELNKSEKKKKLLSFAGLWENRDVSIESIREKSWK